MLVANVFKAELTLLLPTVGSTTATTTPLCISTAATAPLRVVAASAPLCISAASAPLLLPPLRCRRSLLATLCVVILCLEEWAEESWTLRNA